MLHCHVRYCFASSLAASWAHGVMLHHILVLQRNRNTFLAQGSAYAAATGTFFVGILLTVLIHQLVHWLDSTYATSTHDAEQCIPENVQRITSEHHEASNQAMVQRRSAESETSNTHDTIHVDTDVEIQVESSPSDESLPVQIDGQSGAAAFVPESTAVSAETVSAATMPLTEGDQEDASSVRGAVADGPFPAAGLDQARAAEEKRALTRTGLVTALAIGLHNFPEGLATFVAALVSTCCVCAWSRDTYLLRAGGPGRRHGAGCGHRHSQHP